MKNNKWKKLTAVAAAAFLATALVGCSVPADANIVEKIDRVDDVIEERIDAGEEKIEAAIESKVEAIAAQSVKAEGKPKAKLSKDEAKEIALKHAGVDNVTWVKVEIDDGRYEVDFRKDGFEYDYDISIQDGKVIKAEKEREGFREAVNQEPVKEEAPKQESVQKTEFISKDKAKSIALDHAGVSDVTWVKVELDDGKYEVDFRKDGFEYDYDVDARSGKVIKVEKDRDDDYRAPVKEEAPKQEAPQKTELISKDKAKSIALSHAGVSDVTWVKVELDDGKYEVDFRKDGFEYDYEIGAQSGKVIKAEKDRDDDYRAPAKEEVPKQEPVKEEAPKQEAPQKTELIGKDKAKSIALKHAGVSGADWVKVELDDGKYEVEFRKGSYEYDYEIGAQSGKVLKAEKDRDDD